MNLRIGQIARNQMLARNQMPVGGQNRLGKQQQGIGEDLRNMKRMLRQDNGQTNLQNAWGHNSIVDESVSYSEQIRASRENAKKTSLEMKKLQYNFKSISTKILRSKTSASAKQVAGQARREVIRLQQKRNTECDQEELEAAITHAKAMVRLADKKARHLEEEELAKVSGGSCAGEVEEKEELREEYTEESEEETIDPSEEEYVDAEELTESDVEELTAEDLSDAEIDSMSMEEMKAFIGEMQQSMEELLEETGLNDLLEELTETPGEEMDPADYKMMKIKHRCKEMKDLVKADAEYLKAVFKKMEESKGKSLDSFKGLGGGGNIFSGMSSGGGMPAQIHIDVSASDTGESAAAAEAPSIDISI